MYKQSRVIGLLVASCISWSSIASAYTQHQPLVVYAAIGYSKEMGTAFQKATGIPTTIQPIRTGELLSRIEAQKNNPQWNVVWIDGGIAMQQLVNQHLLLPYAPSIKWTSYGKEMQPLDHMYVTTSATFAAVATINTQLLKPFQYPHSWNDLLKPIYHVGTVSPVIASEPVDFTIGQIMYRNQSNAYKFLSQLKTNGLVTYQINPLLIQGLLNKQINVALLQSSAAYGHVNAGMPFHIQYMNPEVLLPRTIAISAKCNPVVTNEATQFVNFVLSPQGQQIAASGAPKGDSNAYTIIKHGIQPSNIPTLEQIHAKGITIQYANPITWGNQYTAIKSWFVNNIVNSRTKTGWSFW